MLRSAIDRLKDEDAWFAIAPEVKAIYPANPSSSTSFNGDGRIYLHEQPDDAWHPDVVLCRFMLHVARLTTPRACARLRLPERPSPRLLPVRVERACCTSCGEPRSSDRSTAEPSPTELALSTLDEIENSETGVQNALRLLRCGERQGWWSHLFGTAQAYPDNRPDDDGDGSPDHPDEVGVKHRLDQRQLPAGPHSLSLWDILRTYRANPAKGWNTDLDVDNPDIQRAARSSIEPSTSTSSATRHATCSGSASTRWAPANPTRACRRSESERVQWTCG